MTKRKGLFRVTALIAALCLAFFALTASGAAAEEEAQERIRVGNPTALSGCFFTQIWGSTTSDLDVQALLHGYSPVRYDVGLSRFRFDHSVVQNAIAIDDEAGNRTYTIILYDDLKWSDGTAITAYDYAFSILFSMDPAIGETGGTPADCSWIAGAEAYLAGTEKELSGLRIINEQMMQITMTAESLPCFYELTRLMIHPYPASVIAPGISAADDGNGAYLTSGLTAEKIRETVLDPESGYLSHPSVVSGPYTLTAYEWPTAEFSANPYFKGTEDAYVPWIGELEYTQAKNGDMVTLIGEGSFDLLNKVAMSNTIRDGLENMETADNTYLADNYARTGLTMLWFAEGSAKVQDPAVRQAIAYCFDRDGFTRDYAGMFGMRVDGFYGIGQWMYRLAAGLMPSPANENATDTERAAAAQAFSGLNLNGLTRYAADTEKAGEALDAAGWKLSAEGLRYKAFGSKLILLDIKVGVPESDEAREALDKHLISRLKDIGIEASLVPMTMEEIGREYRGETREADMIYLGEDFSIRIDPGMLAPRGEAAGPAAETEGSLTAARAEVYALAQEMIRTEPNDLAGFLGKWIRLQERISETLPLIPVYSDVYFDFHSGKLQNYRIRDCVSWGEAIVKCYISDMQIRTEEEQQSLQDAIREWEEELSERAGK